MLIVDKTTFRSTETVLQIMCDRPIPSTAFAYSYMLFNETRSALAHNPKNKFQHVIYDFSSA